MKKLLVLCDLDDTDARPGVAVVEMVVQGVTYEIDVCREHLDSLCKLPPAGHSSISAAEPGSVDVFVPVDTPGSVGAPDADNEPIVAAGLKAGALKAGGARAVPGRRSAGSRRQGSATRQLPAATSSSSSTSPAQIGRRKPGSRRARQERITLAREWARSQGREIADRGRLPAGLLEEFEAAHA